MMATVPRFGRFLGAGVVNTGVTWALFLGLARMMPATAAYTIAYLFGIGLAYVLNSVFVFKTSIGLRTAWRYPLVYAVQYVYGVLAIQLFVEMLNLNRVAVIVFVTLSSLPITFLLTRTLLSDRKIC